MQDFENYPQLPSNQFFNHLNPNYNFEKDLYSLLLTEAYNQHGVCMDYYVVSYNTNYDRLFGEDNDRRFIRNFSFMCYMELPKETKSFSTMGIGWTDIFHLYISKRHFNVASTANTSGTRNIFPSYEPREGDILNTKYNNTYYEIISVKTEEEQFLQRKHSWDVIVRVMRDKSFSYSPETSSTMEDISKYNNKSDLFDIGKFIKETTQPNTNANDIEYKPAPTECDPNDPFNNWVR